MIGTTDHFALVTGTSAGIGAAAVAALLERGWDVMGIARRPSPVRHPRYQHLQADLASQALATSVIPAAAGPLLSGRPWSRVGLVNNAATGGLGGIESLESEVLSRVLTVNAIIPTWLMGYVARTAPTGAALRIVNVSSGAATRAFPGLGAYGSSKAALRMAGQILAAEWSSSERPGGMRGNAAILSYEPGIVDTDMQTAAREQSPEAFPWVGLFKGFQAQARLVTPDMVVGEMVDFLESDSAEPFSERRYSGAK